MLGREIHRFDAIDSTQSPAKEAARRGDPEGGVWVARRQLAGRGRRGRGWSASSGRGLAFSVLMRPSIAPSLAPLVSLACALAVLRAVRAAAPELAPAIKWPNDLLIGERKFCGIICEASSDAQSLSWIVAGIGVNVNEREEDLPDPEEGRPRATSMLIESERARGRTMPFDANELLSATLAELDRVMASLSAGGHDDLIAAYSRECCTLGRDVLVVTERGALPARAVRITESGALAVSHEGRELCFEAADVVHIR